MLMGGIEAPGLIGDSFGLQGRFWHGIATLNDSFGQIGFVVVGLFIAAWIIALVLYRYWRIADADDAA